MNDIDKRPLLPYPPAVVVDHHHQQQQHHQQQHRRRSSIIRHQQQDAALLPLLRRESRPPRHSSRTLFQTSPLTTTDRLTVSHLRRSDLAGWRTRSLFPTRDVEAPNHPAAPLQSFLPVLKLRGLPYFCSKRHVLVWFGDLAPHVVDLFFVAEVEPLNTGFAIVTLDSPQNALRAWRTLHKKPIVGKRFVEVFGLFPPQCPLSRRDSVSGKQGLIPLPPGLEPVSTTSNSGGGDSPPATCPFCGLALGVHSDEGAAALATARMRECVEKGALAGQRAEALMHTAFLSVPALLYQDAGAVSLAEVELFDPDSRRGNGFIEKFAETREVSLAELERAVGLPSSSVNPVLFFDLTGIQGFDMRNLLCEIVRLLHDKQCKSIAEIGNDLTTRGRAYLFLTELKLRNVIESFPDIFMIMKPGASASSLYTVALRGDAKREGVNAIRRMEPFQLTKRRRNRNGEGSNHRSNTNRRLPPLERNATQQSESPAGDLPAAPLVALQRSQTAHRRESVADHYLPRLRPLVMDNRSASYAYSGGPPTSNGAWLNLDEDEGCLGAFATSNEYVAAGNSSTSMEMASWGARRSSSGRPPQSAAQQQQQQQQRLPSLGNMQPTDEFGMALTDLIRTLSMEHEESANNPPKNAISGSSGDLSQQQQQPTSTAGVPGGSSMVQQSSTSSSTWNAWGGHQSYTTVTRRRDSPPDEMFNVGWSTGASAAAPRIDAAAHNSTSAACDRSGPIWPQPTVQVREVPPMWAGGPVDQSEQVLLETLKEKQDEILAIQRALAEHRNQIPPPPLIANPWRVGGYNNASSPPPPPPPPSVVLEDSPMGVFGGAAQNSGDGLLPNSGQQSLLANLAEILQTLAANSPSSGGGGCGKVAPLRVLDGGSMKE